jgi:NADPH:quinone reductase-like Zn-dependent oxidoreductase
VAIDYRNEDFLARVRELTGDGVDIALDPFGGAVSLRSFRALRPGGRRVIYGRQNTIAHGRKNWPAVFEWYVGTAIVGLHRGTHRRLDRHPPGGGGSSCATSASTRIMLGCETVAPQSISAYS